MDWIGFELIGLLAWLLACLMDRSIDPLACFVCVFCFRFLFVDDFCCALRPSSTTKTPTKRTHILCFFGAVSLPSRVPGNPKATPGPAPGVHGTGCGGARQAAGRHRVGLPQSGVRSKQCRVHLIQASWGMRPTFVLWVQCQGC